MSKQDRRRLLKAIVKSLVFLDKDLERCLESNETNNALLILGMMERVNDLLQNLVAEIERWKNLNG
mgnify:FL=1